MAHLTVGFSKMYALKREGLSAFLFRVLVCETGLGMEIHRINEGEIYKLTEMSLNAKGGEIRVTIRD